MSIKMPVKVARPPKARPAHLFKKGQSGNPSGRPKSYKYVVDVAQAHALEALQAVIKIMRSEDASPAVVLAAATTIIERGYGKPIQPVANATQAFLELREYVIAQAGSPAAGLDEVGEQPASVRH